MRIQDGEKFETIREKGSLLNGEERYLQNPQKDFTDAKDVSLG